MTPIITLTSDFGQSDGYPAAMKAVILGIAPDALVIDITHDAAPQAVAHASFVLGATAKYFPSGTIHVGVVDPEVGTGRSAIVLSSANGTVYVGPDSGVFSHVLTDLGVAPEMDPSRPFLQPITGPVPDDFCAYRITEARFMRDTISRTFDGRDVFAPCAAYLSLGRDPDEVGPPIDSITYLNLPGPQESFGQAIGRVQHIDRFGNVVTNIPESFKGSKVKSVVVASREITTLSGSYRDAGDLGAVIGSQGFLEVASYRGRAASLLGLDLGDCVVACF